MAGALDCRVTLLLALSTAAVIQLVGANAPAPLAKVDVALFAAYLPEYQSKVNQMTPPLKNYTYGGRLYTTGGIGNKKVVVTMSGIGMTNAAMTAQQLIILFKPKYMLLSGIAGGIDPSIKIGDVVVPSFWANPQLQKFIRPMYENSKPTNYFEDTVIDFPDKYYSEPGKGKAAGDFGLTLPTKASCSLPPPSAAYLANRSKTAGVTVSPYMSLMMEAELLVNVQDTFMTPTPPTKFWLPASKYILKVAAKVLPTITLGKSVGNASLPYQPMASIVDRGISTNTFLDNPDYRKSIFDLLHPSCVEMEGHAVLQVCISNKVQCAVVRSISDLAGGEPGQTGANELGVFFAVAADNTAKVAVAIVKAL